MSVRRSKGQRKSKSHNRERTQLGRRTLNVIVDGYRFINRDYLIRNRFLVNPPPKGTYMISDIHRTDKGEKLLQTTKDNLYHLLFDNKLNTLESNKEILTITVDQRKAKTFDFLLASTKWNTVGVWNDPAGISDDERSSNTTIEVEYKDTSDEKVGKAILQSVNAINELEVNEQILYARTQKIESSSL